MWMSIWLILFFVVIVYAYYDSKCSRCEGLECMIPGFKREGFKKNS
jgi:hypothetical protein